jgi:hypothetical protein
LLFAFHLLLDAQVGVGIGFQQRRKPTPVADKLLVQRGCEGVELVGAMFALLSNGLALQRRLPG